MELFNDECKLIIHTDRFSEDKLIVVDKLCSRILPKNIAVEKYNHNIEVSWRDINKYAECVTDSDLRSVKNPYQDDVTSDGEWVYPMPKLESGSHLFSGCFHMTKLSVDLPALTDGTNIFAQTSIVEFDRKLPLLKKTEP